MKRTVIENQRGFHISFLNALWADRVTAKNSLGVLPYTIVYGKESILPPIILLPASQLAQYSRGSSSEVLQVIINALLKLEESRFKAKERFKHQQEIVKRWFDKHKSRNKSFEVGYLVLNWDHPHDDKGKNTKFQHLWVNRWPVSDCCKARFLDI